MAKKEVFVIDPPQDDAPGKYVLIIQRGHGMFGSTTAAFAVDSLEFTKNGEKICSIRAILDGKIIVEFSTDTSYLMVDRTKVRGTTMLDIEIEDRRLTEINQKILDKEFPPEKQEAVHVDEDGRVKINTQGYL